MRQISSSSPAVMSGRALCSQRRQPRWPVVLETHSLKLEVMVVDPVLGSRTYKNLYLGEAWWRVWAQGEVGRAAPEAAAPGRRV